ncbi:MAG: hypothetical protein QW476_03040 [Candidatus Bathyarchaeia archaeon]|nr:hypothetical protein [Candidatus Bathyarchaeota archaeon]
MRIFKLTIKIILDSNILISALKNRIQLFKEIEEAILAKVEFITIPAVIKELEKLSVKGGKIGKYASLALNLMLNKCKLINFEASKKQVDEALIEASFKLDAIVATLDLDLKRKLRKANRPIITLRGNRVYCIPENLK